MPMPADDAVARAACYGQERLPRYTSYPTAPHFTPAIDAATYAAWLAAIPADAAASLYLHIPFCRSMCWYCGCNTTVARRDDPIRDYLGALLAEIDLVARHAPRRFPASHVHFGGGTPTILAPAQFERLMERLRRAFPLANDAEIAIEIDPRTLTRPMIAALAAAGVTRASLGVQSFDPAVQAAINRVQSFEVTAAAAEGLRTAGIAALSFDLIYGLPHQTVASCIDTARRSVSLRPDRVSVFGYAHVPSFKPHQRMIDEAVLPDAVARYRQFAAIADTLQAAGYRRIGLDHFCRPGDSMSRAQEKGALRRNFQGYTTDRADVLLGFGASAIGRLPQGYIQNETGARAYARRIADGQLAAARGYALSDDDRLRGDIIERIMCDFTADVGDICARHDVSADAVLASAPRLRDLVADRVVTLDDGVVTLAQDSRFLVRSVAAAFDAHLAAAAHRHSRAV
jgi:oxygen-independent coproporphyrinogen-3 oxidase